VWQETYVDVLVDAIVRRVQVTNRSERTRDLRVVFHHDLALAPGEPRETVQWDAESRTVVHRAGRRVALIDLETSLGAGVPMSRVASRASVDAAGAEALPGGVRLEGPAEASGRCDSIAGWREDSGNSVVNPYPGCTNGNVSPFWSWYFPRLSA